MKNKNKYGILNKYDILIIIITIFFSLGLFTTFKYLVGKTSGDVVNIYYENKIVATLDLNKNQTLILPKEKYPALLADLEVEVMDGKVRISKETSPNNICSKQGWTDSSLHPLVCLPNKVLVIIEPKDIMINGVDFEV
jgi:Uncharacterized protein conserved in bacteria